MLKGIISSLVPKESYHPAFVIKRREQKDLIKFIHELCNKMNTKIPNYILLHSEPTFFVTQGKVTTIDGIINGRILALGMPLLSYLNKNELRAILAHEFAHFTGKDTVYSSFILPAYQSTITAITNMEAYISDDNNNGALMIPMILPIIILRFYYNSLNFSNMRRSREREKRADIIACKFCGSDDFKNALIKVVCISGVFADNAQSQILKTYKEDKVYVNYYDYFRDCKESVIKLSEIHKNNALSEKTELSSSHPCLTDRLQYIPNVKNQYFNDDVSINMIKSAEEYEKSLTSAYTEYIAIINGLEV